MSNPLLNQLTPSAVTDETAASLPNEANADTSDGLWETRPVRLLRAHGAVLCVLVLQTLLTVRLTNSAFQDEAIYVYAGHREIANWLIGTPTYDDYSSYFSGAPFLYPAIAAPLDTLGGIYAARSVSLIFSLGATVMLFLTTRRLFDRKVATISIVVFAVAEPTLFIGHLATYDAAAQFFLALAAWISVRSTRHPIVALTTATPVLVLAIFTKYATMLYVPVVIALASIVVSRDRGWRRGICYGGLLSAGVAAFSMSALAISPKLQQGIRSTTLQRPPGTDSSWDVAHAALTYIGLPSGIALAGVLILCRRHTPDTFGSVPRYLRVLLSAVLMAALLAAPINQAVIHTSTSLHKHVGFGLWFAAPLAGIALAQLTTGPSFRKLAVAVSLCVVMAWVGMTQSSARYHDWPSSGELVSAMRTMVRPMTGRYLVEEHEVTRYYLRDLTEPYQWSGTSYFEYRNRDGGLIVGPAAYQAAIDDGYFDAVALRYGPSRELDRQLATLLNSNPRYERVVDLPFQNSFGTGKWQIWRRN